MRRFNVTATWDEEARVWWGGNDELPLTTEAPTFEEFEARAVEIGREMAEVNGLAAPGEPVEIHVIKDRQARPAP